RHDDVRILEFRGLDRPCDGDRMGGVVAAPAMVGERRRGGERQRGGQGETGAHGGAPEGARKQAATLPERRSERITIMGAVRCLSPGIQPESIRRLRNLNARYARYIAPLSGDRAGAPLARGKPAGAG